MVEDFKMKPWMWILGVVVLLGLVFGGSYNGLVNKDESVKAAWSEVSNVANRRAELIPQLVDVVQGYAEHESSVFKGVTEARAKATSINVDASSLASSPALQKQFMEAQQALSSSLGRLLAVAENYPNLKANESFLKLQDEVAGSTNRITVARKRAIDDSKDYNQAIRGIPGVIVARLGGFQPKEYYEGKPEDMAPPKITFGKKG